METLPDPNTAPTKRRWPTGHALLEALAWVRTGVNVYLHWDAGHESAAPAIKTITEAAVHLVLYVTKLW
ncbi:hypothetical protein [Nocardia tengchongensis]|uniref:hypothetical protein n=1 Tax=Nocardia tengchongensis TaxID=2055889 RepID=UPI0036858746